MSELVIRTWRSNEDGIEIVGRESGLLAWILARVGVDPVTSFRVNADRVEFSQASLSGSELRLIPLQNICSTYYGYHKPWRVAAVYMMLGIFLGITLMSDNAFVGLLVLLAGIGGARCIIF